MKPKRFKTIPEFHRFRGLPAPAHPQISVVDLSLIDLKKVPEVFPVSMVFDFYMIALKRNFPAKVHYGQNRHDFDEGLMSFIAPGQVFGAEPLPHPRLAPSGWLLLVHPDFLWNTPMAKGIQRYEYFSYAVHEALFLSEHEEATVNAIIAGIEREYRSNLDAYSQDIIVAQLELLLTYAQRFYRRQFLTRKRANHHVLGRLEALLDERFADDALARQGPPGVHDVAGALNISPHYLSELLTVLTGQSTQQHLHDRLIAKAKEELSTTDRTVGEIAFRLGFGHSQSFSKLFKKKTNQTPLDFRRSVAF